MAYWLFKTEPDTYGWDRLVREGRTEWSGVRSFHARNLMLEMHLGDRGFFYHSSTKVPGIAGIVEVAREAYPDFSAFAADGPYFDRRSTEAKPIWKMVDVVPERPLERYLSLDELKSRPELHGMPLLRRGQRLSVQPVDDEYWHAIVKLARRPRSDERL